jgi:hypothetical protein
VIAWIKQLFNCQCETKDEKEFQTHLAEVREYSSKARSALKDAMDILDPTCKNWFEDDHHDDSRKICP